ncbi:phospho-N-acetylmuramoyl-pentapeptide-transferase [Butyrivibrio sp. MC2013]|uniref:phospho-N-acetylmuramoyl-pentapeptide- transferase n=1 Tax=Butyrivibrio sp. MC2013 TaxID=1280686 RepID=UPI0003FCDA7D|nr:phospho-N-acetylmuramoyl-pentapeptide-transferase [Butyrivibrio sp. MC2013]
MTNGYLTTIFAPLVASWLLALIAGRFIIPVLKKMGIKDIEREEGLESHKKKAGTPLMGGIIFLLPLLIVSIPYLKRSSEIVSVLILTGGFYLVGVADDYIKVVMHRNLGLRVWQKLLFQFLIMALYTVYVVNFTDMGFEMLIPFAGRTLDLGILNIPFLFLVALATTNGTNFTDGVDGLCASVTAVCAGFFAAAALHLSSGVAPCAAAMIGALLGYLYYNVHPGKVYMGDGGSLAIGGFVTAMAYVLHLQLFIPIVGIIYAVEVLSVVIQVGYFKISGGKRVFRMAPIHHHYEKGGWSETQVVNAFATVTIIAALLGFLALL